MSWTIPHCRIAELTGLKKVRISIIERFDRFAARFLMLRPFYSSVALAWRVFTEFFRDGI
jgi:hypothetical protein